MEEREGRVYKKTNWSVTECLVLQAAKREENDKHDKHRGAKEKWLAIEDYCWEHDVHRSGQQCKDRWYRMALEFKKVYEYQRAIPSGKPSFWQLSGSERKEARLPIVFHQEIYDAMVDWYLNSKPGNGNLVIDTSVPSPADEGHHDASNGNCSGTDEGESDDRSGHSLGNKSKRRKTIAKAAQSLANMVERSGDVTSKALLECEDRKDQRLEKQLEFNERLAVRQLEANERLALKQMDANERIASGYINAIINLADALRSLSTPRSAEPQ
ncbi:hypothetical protein Mapa_004820 [Marchantia paleacea]|nr:hypothetical protein Mapa_004820 [Marchantia paleacea]